MVHCLSLLSIGLLLTFTQALPLHQKPSLSKRGEDNGSSYIHFYCENPKHVALTFDDGPGDFTDELIDYLARNNAPATFFVNANNYWGDDPDRINPILLKAYKKGFEIGSHTYSHADLKQADPSELYDEISLNEEAIHSAIGEYPALIRPPYGNMNDRNGKQLQDWGYTIVNWSIDIEDSMPNKDPSTESEMEIVKKELQDKSKGHIILSHDVKEHTANEFARAVVPYLQKQGLQLVTVSKCLGKSAYKSYGISGDSKSKTTSENESQTNPNEESTDNSKAYSDASQDDVLESSDIPQDTDFEPSGSDQDNANGESTELEANSEPSGTDQGVTDASTTEN
ncbi:unnamed protein product [Cunninghamella blakesleeana]